MRQLVGGDADTGVRDLEHRAWPILPGADRDSAAGQGEFERVAEEAGVHLVHPPLVVDCALTRDGHPVDLAITEPGR